MDGRTYIRAKSSLSRKRVLKSKEFEKTRQYAGSFALASQIGSVIYQALPADIKGRWLYRTITGEAASLLYEGKTEQEAREILWKKYILDTACGNKEANENGLSNRQRCPKESRHLLRSLFYEQWKLQHRGISFKLVWERRGLFRPQDLLRKKLVLQRVI
jgi:hypothetical protein